MQTRASPLISGRIRLDLIPGSSNQILNVTSLTLCLVPHQVEPRYDVGNAVLEPTGDESSSAA